MYQYFPKSNLAQRTLSAVILATLFVLALIFYRAEYVIFALPAKLMVHCLIFITAFELFRLLSPQRAKFYAVAFGLMLAMHLLCTQFYSDLYLNFFALVFLLIVPVTAVEIYQDRDQLQRLTRKLALLFPAVIYLLSFAAFFVVLDLRSNALLLITLVIAVVAVNDTMAYLGGRQFGKAPLCPAISPGKTVFGFFFGWGSAAVVGGLLINYYLGYGLIAALLVAMLIALVAVIGDLLESFMKRLAQVKDSSNYLPGHGGFLDRFDGLLPCFICLLFI